TAPRRACTVDPQLNGGDAALEISRETSRQQMFIATASQLPLMLTKALSPGLCRNCDTLTPCCGLEASCRSQCGRPSGKTMMQSSKNPDPISFDLSSFPDYLP